MTITVEPPVWVASVAERLEQLKSLPANWDNEGAAPMNPAFHQAAVHLARDLAQHPWASEPYVAPTYDGGILFMWENDRFDLELMVEHAQQARFTFLDKLSGEEDDGDFTVGYLQPAGPVASQLTSPDAAASTRFLTRLAQTCAAVK